MNFKKWFGSGFEKKGRELYTSLYGEDGEGGVDSHGIPKGIHCLYNLMQTPSDSLCGFSLGSSHELGKQLGSGSTAVVFSRKNGDGVVKVSRYGLESEIEREFKVLMTLAKDCICDHIPTLIDDIENSIILRFGSFSAKFPALRTKPEGIPAILSFCGQAKSCNETTLSCVLDGVYSALSHMHKKGICHLDVSPKNIVLEDTKAILIDYSLARHQSESIETFLGTPNYKFRRIFSPFQKKRNGNPVWTTTLQVLVLLWHFLLRDLYAVGLSMDIPGQRVMMPC
jgi:serine/threonine protein kinase